MNGLQLLLESSSKSLVLGELKGGVRENDDGEGCVIQDVHHHLGELFRLVDLVPAHSVVEHYRLHAKLQVRVLILEVSHRYHNPCELRYVGVYRAWGHTDPYDDEILGDV